MESSRRDLLNDKVELRPVVKNKGVVRILVIFQHRPMFSYINGKL